MAIDPIFGPLIDTRDVQLAVKSTVQKWIKTYVALVERMNGLDPRSLPLPRSYVLKNHDALSKNPEDQTPAIVIVCPGTAGDPVRDGEGFYRVPYAVSVAAIVSARDEDSTSVLAKRYAAALYALMVHNGSLGGFAEGVRWRGERNDDLRPDGDRTIAVGINVFEVLVPNVIQAGAGLKEPPEEPYEESELPTVDDVEVALKPEEIT